MRRSLCIRLASFLHIKTRSNHFFWLSSYQLPQLKCLLTARGIPLPPADQMQKEILVEILQASDTDNGSASNPSAADAAADAAAAASTNSSLCAAELQQLHSEIIEETAALRLESIKNPVKAQAFRRLTTSLADTGLSSLSSHIPPSQADIKR